jgi:hypothetical protein
MRKALHVGTPVLTTDQTPQAAHSALEGLFITQPKLGAHQQVLGEILPRLDGGWSSAQRATLAEWAEANFAWSRLGGEYSKAYERAARPGGPVERV